MVLLGLFFDSRYVSKFKILFLFNLLSNLEGINEFGEGIILLMLFLVIFVILEMFIGLMSILIEFLVLERICFV